MHSIPIIGRIALAATAAFALAGCASHDMAKKEGRYEAHWSYEGKTGPAQWASMKSDYATCGAGKTQSPIDLPARARAGRSQLAFAYAPTTYVAENSGHTLQYSMQPGSAIVVGGERYELVQFHFHTPSEYRVAGKAWPMEMHLVHKSAKGQLAVVGVMVEAGAARALDRLPRPAKEGEKISGKAPLNPAALLPANRRHYALMGSLTTPPCSENVRWFVMRTPIKAAPATIAAFGKIMGKNARPLMPMNERRVMLSASR